MSEPNWLPGYIVVLVGIPLVSVSTMLVSVRQTRQAKTRASAVQKSQGRLFEMIWFPWRKTEKEADVEVGKKPEVEVEVEDEEEEEEERREDEEEGGGSYEESRQRAERWGGSEMREWPVAEETPHGGSGGGGGGGGGPLSSHPVWAGNRSSGSRGQCAPWSRGGEMESREAVNEDGVSVMESDYTYAPDGDTGATRYWGD